MGDALENWHAMAEKYADYLLSIEKQKRGVL